jgi:hypothetical protein
VGVIGSVLTSSAVDRGCNRYRANLECGRSWV